MAAGSASDQPRETAVQPPLADDYVVEANGNQRARPTAEMLRNQPLLERAAALQINQISKCITILEAMRANLDRMETASVLLETGVVEQLNRETWVEVLEVPTEVIDEKPEDESINHGTEQDNQVLDKPGTGVSNLPPELKSVTTESPHQPKEVNQINQAALASPRQPQEGVGRDRREPALPSLPNQRMPWNLCPGQPSTVFIEVLKDTTSELTYMEWLNSFALYATAQLAQYAIDNLNGKRIWETGRWLYVKQSHCPISTKTSRRGTLIGQPRTGDFIFSTTHPGYDEW